MKYLESVQSEKFYITIDTRTKKLFFRLGPQIVRETDVQIGETKNIAAPGGKNYTFVPLKGGFNVTGKEMGFGWEVPEWVYLMKGEAIPAQRPTIPNGLGQYVIFLPDNYVIHSPPSADSPLQGPKPGSFMVPAADLAAIWPRVTTETRVYIF